MDLISIDSLSDDAIAAILGRAQEHVDSGDLANSLDRLAGRVVFNLF